MRPIFLKLLLLVMLIAVSMRTMAQSGSLGDPVYIEDFGSGPNPGPAFGTDPSKPTTNMQYTTGCPEDGQYNIVHSIDNSNNCHLDTWQNILQDHTGNPNGYMMWINATHNEDGKPPGIFFTVPVPVGFLCPGTTYQFSTYVCNLIKLSQHAGTTDPNITFNITATDGTILATKNTGSIPSNDPSQSPWQFYSVNFTLPPNVSTVIVSIANNVNGGNGNDLVLDDITFRAYGPTISAGFNNVNITTPQQVCNGDPVSFTLMSSIPPNSYIAPAFQWQQNINNGTWVDIPGATSPNLPENFTPALGNTYQYRVGVAEAPNIGSDKCRVYSPPLTVYVNPKITAPPIIAAQSAVCLGDLLHLTASGGVTYVWTKPDGTTSADNPLIISAASKNDEGPYSVVAYNESNCPSPPSSPWQITVNANPVAVAKVDKPVICSGTSTTLHASGGVSYLWSPADGLSDPTSPDPVASPADNTTYSVTVTNSNDCTDVASVSINVLKSPIANAGPDKVIFEGQSVKLTASAQYSDTYSWTPTTGLSDPNILNPIASPTDDITYTLHASSSENCGISTDDVFVRVYKKITIPSSFSPNNDGINDLWDIDALITYPQSILTVFNRNGQQVYRTVGYSKPWDGTYNGQPVPTGTYYYVLDLKNNTPKISGWVVVVR